MALRTRPAVLLFLSILTVLFCTNAALGAERVVLVEELTSQTCPPCYSSNPDIETMLDSYGDRVVSVKWHVWWPSPGDDWFYLINNPVIANRVNVFYSGPTHGAPSLYIDGGPPNPLLTPGEEANTQIQLRLQQPSPMTISGTAATSPGTATVNASVDVNVETPVAPLPTQSQTNKIFATLIEKQVPTGVVYTGTLSAGSPIITGMSDMRYLVKGSIACANGLPGCPVPGNTSATVARISSIDSPTQITLNKNASQTGSRTITFRSYNGETMHHDVFRVINNNGTPLSTGDIIDLTTTGIKHYDFSFPYAADWDPAQFAVVVWVQNMGSGGSNNSGAEVYQAAELLAPVVAVGDQVPAIAQFGRSFPNPFGGSGTTIPFSLAREGNADLAIYDISGRFVRTLASGRRTAGTYNVRWDGLDSHGQAITSGIYFARLKTADLDISMRVVRID